MKGIQKFEKWSEEFEKMMLDIYIWDSNKSNKIKSFIRYTLNSTLQSILEKVGEDIKSTITMPTDPQWGQAIIEHINNERSRIRQVINEEMK